MTLDLHNTTSNNGLFDIQGLLFKQLDNGIAGGVDSGTLNNLATACQSVLVNMVTLDSADPISGLSACLTYLLADMTAGSYYVTASTVGVTVTAVAGRVGDQVLLATTIRGDGTPEQNIIGETIAASVVNASTLPAVRLLSQPAAGALTANWPGGSGLGSSLPCFNPAGNGLVANGSFEQTDVDGLTPTGWQITVGTPGVTVNLTAVPIQTVTISGNPTGGSYVLEWANAQGVTRATSTIGYASTGYSLQSALVGIPGLSNVQIGTSGTAPNYVFSVAFNGVPGQPSLLNAVNHLTGTGSPSVTTAVSVAGSVGSYSGQAMYFSSNGTELTTIVQPVTLQSETVYCCGMRSRRQGAASGGSLSASIVTGVGGAVVTDDAGNPNGLTWAASSMSTSSHDYRYFFLRIPQAVSQPVYLQLQIAGAVTSGANLYFDDVIIAAATQLYNGGPWAIVVGGQIASSPTDAWTIVTTTSNSSALQSWYNQALGTASLGLNLPTSGSIAITDSEIV